LWVLAALDAVVKREVCVPARNRAVTLKKKLSLPRLHSVIVVIGHGVRSNNDFKPQTPVARAVLS
jgi:hypothetical protein